MLHGGQKADSFFKVFSTCFLGVKLQFSSLYILPRNARYSKDMRKIYCAGHTYQTCALRFVLSGHIPRLLLLFYTRSSKGKYSQSRISISRDHPLFFSIYIIVTGWTFIYVHQLLIIYFSDSLPHEPDCCFNTND